MTFANRVEQAAQAAHTAASPYMASMAEICDSIQPIIDDLWAMKQSDAVAYICESFSHIGHQALAVRMYKGQDTE